MRNWGVALSVLILAGACSRGGSSPVADEAPGPFSCPAVEESGLHSLSALSEMDPFARGGKVVLYERSEGLLAQATAAVAAGKRFAVVLREPCLAARGEISRNASASLAGKSGRSYGSWRTPRELTRAELELMAESDACVIGVADSVEIQASADDIYSDPMVASQGHLAMLEAKASYPSIYSRKPTNSSDIVIAVIDTGIDMNHPDLVTVLWKNKKEIADNGIDDDGNGYVDDVQGWNFAEGNGNPQYSTAWSGSQHGTHVAGLAGAQGGNGRGGSGVMGDGAQIMALNVFGRHRGAYSENTASAIEYAADNGADVINMSIGGVGRSAAYESSIAYALKKGVVIFAAAGNERMAISERYFLAPGAYSARFPGMIAVGSVDSSNLNYSVFSNYNPLYVKIAAPGSEASASRRGLLSTWPGDTYARIQGTSMATPVAAGAAALAIRMMRSLGYEPGAVTIEGILSQSAQEIVALRGQVRDGRVLNLKRLADFIQTTYKPRTVGDITTPADPGVPGYKPCATGT